MIRRPRRSTLTDNLFPYPTLVLSPVFLLGHGDNIASGGTMETTAVLAEIIAQELDDAAFFGIYDPEAVEAAMAAGVGAPFDRDVGGKYAMPADRKSTRLNSSH